jgi:hypothetical protein
MSTVKANLSVILKADDVVVAEVNDAALWQRILAVINGGQFTLEPAAQNRNAGSANPLAEATSGNPGAPAGAPLDRLAAQLGVAPAVVEGACSPTMDAPYLQLDLHCWEAMKRKVPERGPGSVSPVNLAATLLALWFRSAGLGNPTQSQALAVLGTIGVSDKNPSRSIKNTSSLQGRPGGQIVLNPAAVSLAVRLARCFCTKDWSTWNVPASS